MSADPVVVERLHRRVLESPELGRRDLRADLGEWVAQALPLASPEGRADVISEVLSRVSGLGPLEPLLADATVSELMVNGPGPVWVERAGRVFETEVVLDAAAVDRLVERIVSPSGRRVDMRSPTVDGRLADGSRVHVAVPPVALDGPYVTIRRFVLRRCSVDEFAPVEVADVLRRAVRRGYNIVVSGGTGAGKTTLLNALAAHVAPTERVITIEDAAELRLRHRHVVRLETRPESTEGGDAVTMRELVRNALRMRPDRLVVGEVRGAEALDLVQALNTGHAGCLATIHANGPDDALRRLAALALGAGDGVPHEVLRTHLGSAVDLVIHVSRLGAHRRVTEVGEVAGDGTVRSLMRAGRVVASFTRQARRHGPVSP